MGQRKRTVWVVMHYEIMGRPDSPHVDAVQAHVASSLDRAENFIRGMQGDSHSWWQVHPHVVDSNELIEGQEVVHYSHRAVQLKAAPTRHAIIAYKKYAARHPERFPPAW